MEQIPQSEPKLSIPWRRSWFVLACFLVMPWVLRIFIEGNPLRGDATVFVIAVSWVYLQLVWWSCVSALVIRRSGLESALKLSLGIVWGNFLILLLTADLGIDGYYVVICWALGICVVCFLVTLALRLFYTIAHTSELPRYDEKPSQFSLRTIFVATVVLAVITAIVSMAINARGMQHAMELIPWLMLILVPLLWNELLLKQIRWLTAVICSGIWIALWCWINSARANWLIAGMTTLLIYGLPLGYRWAAWRILPLEKWQRQQTVEAPDEMLPPLTNEQESPFD